MTLGEKLQVLRTQKKLSQKAVAAAAGMHANTYGGYERGAKKPSDAILEKLAEALGCSLEELHDDAQTAANEAAPVEAVTAVPEEAAPEAEEAAVKPAKKEKKEKKAAGALKKAVRKAAVKKSTADVAHIFEVDGDQIRTDDITDRIYEAYKAEGHRIGNIKTLEIYYNLSERRAYYVINGKAENQSVEF